MTDWNSPAVIAQAFYAATALMWLFVGIFAYDCCQYLWFDLSIVFGKRQRRWAQLPYLLSKLLLWSYLVSTMVLILANTEIDCKATLYAIETQMGLITVCSSVMLAFRAVCVYSGKARTAVTAVLGIMTLGLLVAWMQGVNDVQAAWIPNGGNPWAEGTCFFTSISKEYAIKYIVTIVFDFVVMALTIIGVVRMNSGSRIGTVLVQQGLQYFLATFLINALVAGLTLANLNPVMSLICAIPSATVCVMCSTRLYVNLAQEAKPKPDGVDSSRLSTSWSGSEKFSRFFKRSSRLHPSFALRSTASSSNNGTAVNSHGVSALSYNMHNGAHSTADVKSLGTTTSHEDVEAQAGLRATPIVNIIEERTVVAEPMPEHLAGVLSSQETANAGVKGHFPRLSKS
ncbi:hypothetical protein PHBOTO_002554 [Pseudozyma hubeiensis]|nr:hypothetical protein PHBOTO_002554 [Pseudozyma hubeiensis]